MFAFLRQSIFAEIAVSSDLVNYLGTHRYT